MKNNLFLLSNINKKNNRKIITIIVLCGLLMVLIQSFTTNMEKYINYGIKKQYDYNDYLITYDPFFLDEQKSIDILKKNSNIINIVSSNYMMSTVDVIYFNNMNINGKLSLVGLNNYKIEELIGKKIDNNQIFCNKNIMFNNEYELNHFISSKDIYTIKEYNNFMTIKYHKYSNERIIDSRQKELKVADVIDNNNYMVDENTCYCNYDLIKEIYDYSEIDDGETYEALLISITKKDEESKVINELNKYGLSMTPVSSTNDNNIHFINVCSIVLRIIIPIIMLVLILNIIKIKFNYLLHYFGVLLSFGYSKIYIKNIIIMEFKNIIIKSMIIFYLINAVFILLLHTVLNLFPFIFLKFPFDIDIKSIIIYTIFIIMLLLILFIINIIKFNKKTLGDMLNDN